MEASYCLFDTHLNNIRQNNLAISVDIKKDWKWKRFGAVAKVRDEYLGNGQKYTKTHNFLISLEIDKLWELKIGRSYVICDLFLTRQWHTIICIFLIISKAHYRYANDTIKLKLNLSYLFIYFWELWSKNTIHNDNYLKISKDF